LRQPDFLIRQRAMRDGTQCRRAERKRKKLPHEASARSQLGAGIIAWMAANDYAVMM
jgi:hypothetical protein